MWPRVEWNDASLVDHFVNDRDETRRLNNLVAVSVDGRHHRSRDAARDAPVIETAVFPRVGWPSPAGAPRRSASRDALSRFGSHRRDLAVGRIDDEPCLASFDHVEI